MKSDAKDFNAGPVSDLPGETLLVRQDVVKSGDVLLTFGGGAVSAAISQLSGGPFSHAAVFVSPLDVLESYDMIAHASLEPVGQGTLNGKTVYLAKLPHDPQRAALWRHPQPVDFDSAVFQDAYAAILKEQWGYDYPPYARLVPLAQLPEFVKALGKAFFKNYPAADFPGDFCSQLVARFYQHLQLPLFNVGRPPETISPNDLSHSNLVEVTGAIVRRDEIKGFRPDLGVMNHHRPGYAEGDAGAGVMRNNLALSKQLDDLEEMQRKRFVQSAESRRDMMKEQAGQLKDLLAAAHDLSMPRMEIHVIELWVRFAKVTPDLFQPMEAPGPAIQAALSDWGAIGRSLLRCHTILLSQIMRRKIQAQRNPQDVKRMKDERRNMLREKRKLLSQLLKLTISNSDLE